MQMTATHIRKLGSEIDLVESKLVLEKDAIAPIEEEILFLAFCQKKIETESGK